MKKLCAWCGVKDTANNNPLSISGGTGFMADLLFGEEKQLQPVCYQCIHKALSRLLGEPKYLDECRKLMHHGDEKK